MSSSDVRHLLVSSGNGPSECRRAVALVLSRMRKEAASHGVRIDVEMSDVAGGGEDPSSALITLSGDEAPVIVRRWAGTIQWTCQSPFRSKHKRRNWFVGVFEMDLARIEVFDPRPQDLKVETFRSGGPGGQHQNTTDSGVRITHLPTGTSAISTDERSQHRNKQVALRRLASKFLLKQEEVMADDRSSRNRLHKQLERGNPVRVFRGERFSEACAK
jgi:peptide chain release factor